VWNGQAATGSAFEASARPDRSLGEI